MGAGRSVRVAMSIAAASWVMIGALPVRAESPCGAPFPEWEYLTVFAGAPTNVSIMARTGHGFLHDGSTDAGVSARAFELSDADTATPVPLNVETTPTRSGWFVEIQPAEELLPRTRYWLRPAADAPDFVPSESVYFMTADGPDVSPPPAPVMIDAAPTTLGPCESLGLTIDTSHDPDDDAQALFVVRTNEPPAPREPTANLGVGPTPVADVVVGGRESLVRFEVIAIDLAGNRSDPSAPLEVRTDDGQGCSATGRPEGSNPSWLVLALLVARRIRQPIEGRRCCPRRCRTRRCSSGDRRLA